MNVTVLHTALGLTDGTRRFAEQIAEAAGGALTLPDFHEGQVFDTVDAAMAHLEQVGYKELFARLDGLDVTGQLLVGASLGASFAQRLVAHGAAPSRLVLVGALNPHQPQRPWPGVDTQLHHFTDDPFVDDDLIAPLADAVRASGAEFRHFPTEGPGHLCFEPSQPEYDADLTARTVARITG